MKCRNCGVELEPEARYCQDCGTPVGDAPTRNSTYKPAQANVGPKRSPRNIAIGTICIALIVAVAFGAATVLGLGRTSSTEASSSASSGSASTESSSESSASASTSSTAASSSASSDKSEEVGWDGIKAEAKARKNATDAGMQVLTGTVHITTYGALASQKGDNLAKSVQSVSSTEVALFEFSMQEDLSAIPAGSSSVETRHGQQSIAISGPWNWEEFDEQLVTIAAFPEDLIFPADVSRYLFSAYGNAILIAPLNEARDKALFFTPMGYGDPMPDLPADVEKDSKSASSASSSASSASSSAASPATPSGDYVLAESSTRTYTKSELAKLSDYELFIARNEIYARHGRMFQSADLQKYFESKSWYKGTTPASEFNESVLSDTELANAALIRELEQANGSQYL